MVRRTPSPVPVNTTMITPREKIHKEKKVQQQEKEEMMMIRFSFLRRSHSPVVDTTRTLPGANVVFFYFFLFFREVEKIPQTKKKNILWKKAKKKKIKIKIKKKKQKKKCNWSEIQASSSLVGHGFATWCSMTFRDCACCPHELHVCKSVPDIGAAHDGQKNSFPPPQWQNISFFFFFDNSNQWSPKKLNIHWNNSIYILNKLLIYRILHISSSTNY